MLEEIKREIKSIIDDIDNLKNDIDYYEDAETTEDLDFKGWYRSFMKIISQLEKIIEED
ncbi:hypothetical protein [Spiroplasma endosymbiont of Megaselia nigra]|uniref:hypothetical protein n=1 Tax=Spiroplasma endosymbiont of Megaselia nigra TaxID=2478537 RepID=UPI0013153AF2|nr:hypothetical protein [Spiroplasma endosymbiont of Megaselia nigra]